MKKVLPWVFGGLAMIGCGQESADDGGSEIPAGRARDMDPSQRPAQDGGVPDAAPAPIEADAAPDPDATVERILADGAVPDAAPEPDAAAPDPGPCGDGRPVVDLNAALAADGHYDGDTTGAAAGLVGTCGGAAGGEVVLKYTVDAIQALTFATDFPETTAPTVLYVREDCPTPGDLVCNRGSDDSPGTRVGFEPPHPGTYYVVVDTGSRSGGGPFRLGVETEAVPVCRDQRDNDADGVVDLADPGCASAEDDDEHDPETPPLCANGTDDDEDGRIDYPADPDCEAAGSDAEVGLRCALEPELLVVPPMGGQVPIDTNGHADNYQGSCGGSGPEQVVAIRTNVRATLTFETIQAGFDTLIWVRRACDDGGTELGCNDDSNGVLSQVVVPNAEPGTYYMFVDGFGGRPVQTAAQITVTPTP
jgi:hypothetical protein